MNIGTKLVLLLTLTVGGALFFSSYLSMRAREAALETALRDELRAHAVTLQIALEENFANGETVESQRVIDRLRENSRVYAVLMFDERGRLMTNSQPTSEEVFRSLPEISEVLAGSPPVEAIRDLESGRYLSVIMPLRISPTQLGALEIVKPLSLIEDDVRRSRVNWLTTALFLLAVIFLVVGAVLNRSLTRPFRELLAAAGAIGRGDLEYRVPVAKSRDELALLGIEFNRMADSLAEQRRVAEKESDGRLALERELRHSERLASVGRLAAGIAHELGAPLNVIDARAAQLLERPDAPDEKRIRNLTIVRAQTEKISRLVRQLLTLARPFDFRIATGTLAPVVAATLDHLAENLARGGVEVDFAAESDPPVEADRDYLQQVFTNIVVNAIHAMPNGGALTVRVGVSVRGGERCAAVTFRDSGAGIAESDLDRIFDPFYTTKDIGEGTGLGLAVSRRVVEEHGGALEAANSSDGGAVFTVLLPLAEKE